jgi:hypothetical protein
MHNRHFLESNFRTDIWLHLRKVGMKAMKVRLAAQAVDHTVAESLNT